MTSSPPCPMCGWQLRWFADQQAWGCDQCRVMHPPHNAQHSQTTLTRPAPAASRTALVVAIGVAAIGSGVIAAVLVTGPNSGRAGTAKSVRGAVDQTFAALGRGDLPALLANADPAVLKAVATCEGDTSERDRNDLADLTAELDRAARRERGATFEVLDVEAGEVKRLDKGEAMGAGCTLSAPVAAHKLDVKLKVTRDGQADEVQARVTVTEVDGHFLVLTAPKLPGCSEAVARAMLLTDRAAKPDVYNVARCRKDRWSPEQTDCVARAVTLVDLERCLQTP